MHEAKTHLSRLVDAAARGEPFVIARAGRPLVKVVPVEEEPDRARPPFGFPRKERGGFERDGKADRQRDGEIRRMFEDSAARSLFPDPDPDPDDRDGGGAPGGQAA